MDSTDEIMKNIVIDLDETLTLADSGDYAGKRPRLDVLETLRKYKEDGFKITIFTSRNMRIYEGNIGLINANTLPIIHAWLLEHDVPFDEILVGKPWCGFDGFYIDDKAIRPSEFTNLSYDEIQDLLKKEKQSVVSG